MMQSEPDSGPIAGDVFPREEIGLGQSIANADDSGALAKIEASRGDALFRQGNHRAAMAHFDRAVRLRPNEARYHLCLACAAWQAGDADSVEPHFRAALALQPNDAATHAMMSAFFIFKGRLAEAMHHSALAVTLGPRENAYKIAHADALWADRQFDAAREIVQPLIAADNGGPWLARLYAKMAPRFAEELEAVAMIDRQLGAPALSSFDRTQLHFAAAGLLDSLGRFDAAFDHANNANESVRELFDPAAHSKYISERISFFTRARLDALPRATHGNRRPLLIVGMPRSGTSLVEQILASHPDVFGAGELNYLSESNYSSSLRDWSHGEPFPTCWKHLSIDRANELAARYLGRIAAINGAATYVTDKMPTNFLFLGHAQLLLPDCRVIHCVRDPRDTCLSCYFTNFAYGNSFSCNLSHLSGYYRDYLRLMNHWKRTLTLPIQDVRYEDVIADQEGQTRRMLAFLGLPWNARCMEQHQNKRHVSTASRDQVRRPIYSTSVGRWKRYEKHIPQLLELSESHASNSAPAQSA